VSGEEVKGELACLRLVHPSRFARLTLRDRHTVKVGILQFDLLIDGAESLKDKRRVVKSLKDRLHREHMVSVAEVGDQEIWNRASMGLVCVSADGGYLGGVLSAIVRRLESLPDARLGGYSADVVDAGDLGDFTGEDGRPLWTEDERRGDNSGKADRPPDDATGKD
jgi:uncharacterized protein YlxP (DUF503 family)